MIFHGILYLFIAARFLLACAFGQLASCDINGLFLSLHDSEYSDMPEQDDHMQPTVQKN